LKPDCRSAHPSTEDFLPFFPVFPDSPFILFSLLSRRGATDGPPLRLTEAADWHRVMCSSGGTISLLTLRVGHMSFDEGAGTEFSTMRGRNYPAIRQFTVFLENRVGQLLEVVRRFEGSRVHIVSLSIVDSAECAFVRFLLSHPEEGREILERAGLAIIESDLIGVELPEGPQPLLKICTALLQAEVNIIQAYPLLFRPHGRPAVALMVDNIEMGLETLGDKGFAMITEADLQQEE